MLTVTIINPSSCPKRHAAELRGAAAMAAALRNSGQLWTEHEDDLVVELSKAGLSSERIAGRVFRTGEAVRYRLRKLRNAAAK